MLNLKGHATTPDKIKLITSAVCDVDTIVSFADEDNSLLPAASIINFDSEYHTITTATTQDICAGIANANHRRNVKHVSIRNAHATSPVDVTVVVDAIDGNDYEEHKVTLLAGERLGFDEGIGWFKTAGSVIVPLLFNAAGSAVTGFAADTYVVGSDLLVGGRLKVFSIMRWRIHMTKTAAGVATPSIVVRFGTAGAIGDTARCTLAGPAQTAVVDEAILEIEAVVWTAGASGVVRAQMGLQHSAAVAAGFGELFDGVTSGAFDLTGGTMRAGISMNGGASAAWTTNLVTAEALNLAA